MSKIKLIKGAPFHLKLKGSQKAAVRYKSNKSFDE